jgi:hypothetical protein
MSCQCQCPHGNHIGLQWVRVPPSRSPSSERQTPAANPTAGREGVQTESRTGNRLGNRDESSEVSSASKSTALNFPPSAYRFVGT